jgi:hypothetical protein
MYLLVMCVSLPVTEHLSTQLHSFFGVNVLYCRDRARLSLSVELDFTVSGINEAET